MLRKKEYYIQCLFPGAYQDKGKHSDGKCQIDFVCKHRSNETGILSAFSKNLSLTFHTNQQTPNSNHEVSISKEEKTIYILQIVSSNIQFFTMGSCDIVSRYNAIKAIGVRAVQELPGPISIGGVGNAEIKTTHGIYRVKLSFFDRNDAVFNGVCLDQITVHFPEYPLQGRVENDIRNDHKQIGVDMKNLPNLPRHVGGNADFMIGIRHLRYHPEKIFQLYQVYLSTNHGSKIQMAQEVPLLDHLKFSQEHNQISRYQAQMTTFLSNQYHMFKTGFQVNPDIPLLHTKVEKDYMHDLMVESNEKGTCYDKK